MFQSKRERFRGVVAGKKGSFAIIHALENDILRRGGQIQYKYEAKTQDLNGNTVVAVPVGAAAELLHEKHPVLARRIAHIRMAPIVTMTSFYTSVTGPRAFGCLIARGCGPRALGVLLNDAIFPQRGTKPSETWILGGADDPKVIALSDRELDELRARERTQIFGNSEAPLATHVTRWGQGLPIYDPILEDVLKDLEVPRGLWLHGNWLGGIGLSKILRRSNELAERISKEIA